MVATDTNGSRRDAIWIIPCERMKAPREHRVPLPAGAQNLSARRNKVRRYVFSTAPMAEKPVSNMNMAMLLRRADMGHVTVHGFRFNFRNWAAQQTSHPPQSVRALPKKVEAAYLRWNLLDNRRALMEDWSRFCFGTELGGTR